METLSPISKRISLLLRKSHKRPHLSVGYFTKKKGVCQGLFLAGHSPPFFLPGTVPRVFLAGHSPPPGRFRFDPPGFGGAIPGQARRFKA